ncbi:MAG: hypothetical protein ABFD13_03655 [Candidatus Cryosericum sp.]|nr:hypothetical protein [bacterium]
MESVQRHTHIGKKTKKVLFIVIALTAVLCAMLLVWRPWYVPTPFPVPDPWVHITYTHEELQQAQSLADSGKRPDLMDPRKTLTSFLAADYSGKGPVDLRPQLNYLSITQVQSIQDEGDDPTNGDRLFLVTFSQQENVVVFRLRKVPGTKQTRIWYVVGYLITSSSTSRASYSTTWQEPDGPGGQ